MKKLLFILLFVTFLFAQNTDLDTQQRSGDYYLYRAFLKSSDRFVVDNHAQDQTTSPFHYYLMREDKTDISLIDSVTIGGSTFIASSGHGFTASGEYVSIFGNGLYTQSEVVAVDADTITILSPFANLFVPGATVIRGSIDMNVDADTTSQEFVFNYRDGIIPIDVQCIHVVLQHGSAADDSKFGDLAALTNGVAFRKENLTVANFGVYRSNQDFKEFGAVVNYTDKAGGGNHSTTAVFKVKDIYGVVVRFDPRTQEAFIGTTRDDLSTLVRFRIALMGQFTEGE